VSTHSQYLAKLFTPTGLKEIVRLTKKNLAGVEFDSIAITGASGMIAGGMLSAAIKKPLVLVRKETDNSHSSYKVEGPRKIGRYVIFDDTIADGHTVRKVVKALDNPTGIDKPGVFVGAVLWRKKDSWHRFKEPRFYPKQELKALLEGQPG
jgi:orotate phosphoribosyltransferase